MITAMLLLVMCVSAKSTYNQVCSRFAEYIVNNRKKDSDKRTNDADRIKEIQNIKAAAAQEKERAVAAALEQGRSEGAKAAMEGHYPSAQPYQAAQAVPQSAPASSQAQPQAMPVYGQSPVMQPPAEEMLYNEYGEPVMVRRRVRRTQVAAEGEMLYDGMGNPVIRRNQGLWEPIEPRREIVVKLETAPNTTAFVTNIEKTEAAHPVSGDTVSDKSPFANYTYGYPPSGQGQ